MISRVMKVSKTATFVTYLLGWWVLWVYHAEPYVWGHVMLTAGWEGSAAFGDRSDCLRVLHRISEQGSPTFATCIPAGILLRPLSVRVGEPQPPRIRPFAEWDIAPEFQP